jgi:hypothetical protein
MDFFLHTKYSSAFSRVIPIILVDDQTTIKDLLPPSLTAVCSGTLEYKDPLQVLPHEPEKYMIIELADVMAAYKKESFRLRISYEE